METQTLITINNFNCLLHCYCGKTGLSRFPSSTAFTFLLFFLLVPHHHHRISVVFPSPPPPSPHFYCFDSLTICLPDRLFEFDLLGQTKAKEMWGGWWWRRENNRNVVVMVEEENNGNVMVVAVVGDEGKQ